MDKPYAYMEWVSTGDFFFFSFFYFLDHILLWSGGVGGKAQCLVLLVPCFFVFCVLSFLYSYFLITPGIFACAYISIIFISSASSSSSLRLNNSMMDFSFRDNCFFWTCLLV